MTKRTRILPILLPFAALAVAPTSALSSQEDGALPPERLGPGGQIIIGQRVSIPSEVFDGDRQILLGHSLGGGSPAGEMGLGLLLSGRLWQ